MDRRAPSLRPSTPVAKLARRLARQHLPGHTSFPVRPHLAAPLGRVLVVDNERTILRVVRRILGADYELIDATLAADAVALITGGTRFDAILCDLLMPGLSGQDFYRHLLSVDPLVANRVIFMTGAATLPDVRHFLSLTGSAVLEKPFTRAALQAAVRSRVHRDAMIGTDHGRRRCS